MAGRIPVWVMGWGRDGLRVPGRFSSAFSTHRDDPQLDCSSCALRQQPVCQSTKEIDHARGLALVGEPPGLDEARFEVWNIHKNHVYTPHLRRCKHACVHHAVWLLWLFLLQCLLSSLLSLSLCLFLSLSL